MEAIECHCAEQMTKPLLLGSLRELREQGNPVIDVAGLPRLTTSNFHDDRMLLWVAGIDVVSGKHTLVPLEAVHLNFCLPLPTGSGAFLQSSNGLASGNHYSEALSHAICELVERDANTLSLCCGVEAHDARRLDLSTIDDESCRAVVSRFEDANIAVAVWDTTSDIGIPSFLCNIVDADRNVPRCMPPIEGSGCHPRRGIALLRALTEAAQGRLIIISGTRDDLGRRAFDPRSAAPRGDRLRELIRRPGLRSFRDVPDIDNDTFDADVDWELARLVRSGLREVVAVDVTKFDGIAAVRVVIPYLEAMSEVPGLILGRRARRTMEEAIA
jgi:ribosomal protein S12 methylthiotransferase accessory factor